MKRTLFITVSLLGLLMVASTIGSMENKKAEVKDQAYVRAYEATKKRIENRLNREHKLHDPNQHIDKDPYSITHRSDVFTPSNQGKGPYQPTAEQGNQKHGGSGKTQDDLFDQVSVIYDNIDLLNPEVGPRRQKDDRQGTRTRKQPQQTPSAPPQATLPIFNPYEIQKTQDAQSAARRDIHPSWRQTQHKPTGLDPYGRLASNDNPYAENRDQSPATRTEEAATKVGRLSSLAQVSAANLLTVTKRGQLGVHLIPRSDFKSLARVSSTTLLTTSKRGILGDHLMPRSDFKSLAQKLDITNISNRRILLAEKVVQLAQARVLAEGLMTVTKRGQLGDHLMPRSSTGLAQVSAENLLTVSKRGQLGGKLLPRADFKSLAQVSMTSSHMTASKRGHLGDHLLPRSATGLAQVSAESLHTVTKRGMLGDHLMPRADFKSLAQVSMKSSHMTASRRGRLGNHLLPRSATGLARVSSSTFSTVSKRGHIGDHLTPRSDFKFLAQVSSGSALTMASKRSHLGDHLLPRSDYNALASTSAQSIDDASQTNNHIQDESRDHVVGLAKSKAKHLSTVSKRGILADRLVAQILTRSKLSNLAAIKTGSLHKASLKGNLMHPLSSRHIQPKNKMKNIQPASSLKSKPYITSFAAMEAATNEGLLDQVMLHAAQGLLAFVSLWCWTLVHAQQETNFFIDWSPQYQNVNQSYYISIPSLTLSHRNCSVETAAQGKGIYRLKPFNASSDSSFSPLMIISQWEYIMPRSQRISVTESSTSGVTIYYFAAKVNTSCIAETIGSTPEANFTQKPNSKWMVTFRQRYYCLYPPNMFANQTFTNFEIENALTYFENPGREFFVYVYFNPDSQNSRVEFRMGVFAYITVNITNPQTGQSIERKDRLPDYKNARSMLLFEVSNSTTPRNWKGFKIVHLCTFNDRYKQFIVYEQKASQVYVVTNYDSGNAATSNLSMFTQQVPCNASRISYINSEFLIIECPTTRLDKNNHEVNTFQNLYIRLPLGKPLDAAAFKNLPEISLGRMLGFYTSIDRSLLLFDFELPDLDGSVNETPVSTYYYSKDGGTFMLFADKLGVHRSNSSFVKDSYTRYNTDQHIMEMFRYTNATNQTVISLTERTTGRPLGEYLLNDSRKTATVKYFPEDSAFFIKYVESDADLNATDPPSNTLIIGFRKPFVFYQFEGDPETKPAANSSRRRALQIGMNLQNSTTILEVKCKLSDPFGNPLPGNPQVVMHRIKFTLVGPENEYFMNMSASGLLNKLSVKDNFFGEGSERPFRLNGSFPNGLDVSMFIDEFVKGSFVESYFNRSDINDFEKNPNLRDSSIMINLSSTNLLDQPIYFEVRRSRSLTRSLVLDYANKTSFFRFDNQKGEFQWIRDAVDNRHVSSVEIIDGTDAMLNVSKNIFALDLTNLQEKPLTGVGSFCKDIAFVKMSRMPSITICLTENSMQAHYTDERFSAQQTNLVLIETSLKEIMQRSTIVKLLYTRLVPNHLFFVLNHFSNYTCVEIHEFRVGMELQMVFQGNINLTQVTQTIGTRGGSILRVTFYENNLVFVMRNLSTETNTFQHFFITYQAHLVNVKGNRIELYFKSKWRLEDHFKPDRVTYPGSQSTTAIDYKLTIETIDKIRMFQEPLGESYFQTERDYIVKMIFLLRIDSYNGAYAYKIVLFEPERNTYDAFTTLVRGDGCKKLYMGPAFITEGERQERSIICLCLKKNETENSRVKLFILNKIDRKIFFSENSKITDFYRDEPDHAKVASSVKKYEITFYKSHQSHFFQPNDSTAMPNYWEQLTSRRNVEVEFSETYGTFRPRKVIDSALLTDKLIPHQETFADVFRQAPRTNIVHKINQYFEGHIFNTHVECESPLECRDYILNATVQIMYTGKLTAFPEAINAEKFRVGQLQLPKSYDPNYEFSYLLTVDSLYIANDGRKTQIDFKGLGTNCTEFRVQGTFAVGLCTNNRTSNYFRIFDFKQDMSYFDVAFKLPNNRIIYPNDLTMKMKDGYLVLVTYNYFFRRYLTVFVFKIVTDNLYEQTSPPRYYSNFLRPDFGFFFIEEIPLNVENVEFSVHRSNATQERFFLWATRRRQQNSLLIKIDGLLIESVMNKSNLRNVTSKQICDDRQMYMNFKLNPNRGAGYLLDRSSIIAIDSESPDFYDMILVLPEAQDYLIRMNRSMLENSNGTSVLDLSKAALLLSISNPFFGIKIAEPVAPVFHRDMYYVGANFLPNQSVVRCYHIGPETKKQAKPLKSGSLFDFIDKDPLDDRNSVEEKDLDTVYTFGLVNFSKFILSVSSEDMQNRNISDLYRDLYVFFLDGEFSLVKLSQHVQMESRMAFLASRSISLNSQGPKALRSISIKMESNPQGLMEMLIFTIQFIALLGIAGGFLYLFIVWQRSSEVRNDMIELEPIEHINDEDKDNDISRTFVNDGEESSRVIKEKEAETVNRAARKTTKVQKVIIEEEEEEDSNEEEASLSSPQKSQSKVVNLTKSPKPTLVESDAED